MTSILHPRVTRRDLINGVLVGAGTALLAGRARSAALPSWNGFGGVGDYARSNGNVWEVAEAAHRIRDGDFADSLSGASDTGEDCDLVIVGGGMAGLGAMHEFRKIRPDGRCLILENHAIFGGYARANEFDVDGFRFAGAQGSLNFLMPQTDADRTAAWWDELGLPASFTFASRQGGDPAIRFARSTSAPLYHGEQSASMGCYFGDGSWVKDMWRDDLARTPWPETMRAGLLALRTLRRRGPLPDAEARRLDRITFADYATGELGLDAGVVPFITQGMCISGGQISAYAARSLPGLERYAADSNGAQLATRFLSFPGGNAVIARLFVKAAIADAFAGPNTPEAVSNAALNRSALDRAGAPVRIRLGATVVQVKHDGDPASADTVGITYEQYGRLHRVRSRAVVMAVGNWVRKHVVADLPAEQRAAMDQFHFAPILMANVALTNWRFLDRLGVSAMRWFDGPGFYANVRQPMQIGAQPPPFHPDRPIVMTMYMPLQNPDLPLAEQGPAGRAALFSTSYADYEAQIVGQMQRMFAGHGFDARRDIAGVVLNRWGHAFVMPGPGFHFGSDGGPSPLQMAGATFGRIAMAQTGMEDWLGAAKAGARAASEAMALR